MIVKKNRALLQQGVTFLEVLIVMGLLSILLLIILTIFTATIDNQVQTEAYSSTVADGRFIMARLNYDISHASSVTMPATLGASTPNLGLVVRGMTYDYGVINGDLQLTDVGGTANLNDDNVVVSNVTFQELGNSGGKPTIHYSFTIAAKTQHANGPNSLTLSGTAGLR